MNVHIQECEFAVGDKVTCRFMPGSVGSISEVDQSRTILFGHKYKVMWESHQYLQPGEVDESDWLSESELRPIGYARLRETQR